MKIAREIVMGMVEFVSLAIFVTMVLVVGVGVGSGAEDTSSMRIVPDVRICTVEYNCDANRLADLRWRGGGR